MEQSTRSGRNRQQNRRIWSSRNLHPPAKRLFTPEIKRMLKDWLVRRRDNPYPSREEKKALAYETGLTYTQICNWFANWRRKLKNSEREPTKKTWGYLIKNYNTNTQGNVEQFSICSNDSIWGDDEPSLSIRSNSPIFSRDFKNQLKNNDLDVNCNQNQNSKINNFYKSDHCQYYQKKKLTNLRKSSSWYNISESYENKRYPVTINSNYKQYSKEKQFQNNCDKTSSPLSNAELSKWLESAANFTPNKQNYCIKWNSNRNRSDKQQYFLTKEDCHFYTDFHSRPVVHQKEELDAAEALANLACSSNF